MGIVGQRRAEMVLTAEQRKFFEDYGYLKYDKKVLADQELEAVRQRSKDIATGKVSHVPSRFIQLEAKFREEDDSMMNFKHQPAPEEREFDQVRKLTHLSQFDELFEATAKKPEIVDVIEELLGPNIKLYTEQLMMKPRFNGTVTNWHQDSVSFPWFLPQVAVSCWVALDDATVENGCMTVIPGSHKWGPVAKEYRDTFLDSDMIREPVPVEVKAGECMFHHGLNWHRTGANNTPHRRRGLALHYIKSETMYLPNDDEDEETRLYREAEKPKGEFRFMLIRGKEFDGRV
jgi:hypothetical protein